jgi:BirA family biotin operon repressor/biotin-[acetyl-CoA-carboxylase] ligase
MLILREYCGAMFRRRGWYCYRDEAGIFEAICDGVEANGKLLLRRRNGEVRGYLFKEIEYIL